MLRLRDPKFRAGGLLGGALLVLALLANCNDPQAPGPDPAAPPGFRGNYDHGGALEFKLETPGGGVSALRLVAGNLTFDPATQELRAEVAIRNTGGETLPGPRGVLVGSFDPPDVAPTNAQDLPCPMCPNCPCPFPFMFVHAGTYGQDGVLSPGETSTAIAWIFHDPSGGSFSFRALLLQDEGPRPGVISGSVFADANGDGRRQASESGIAGAGVTMLHGDLASGSTTDANGRFEFQVHEAGLYEVLRQPSNDCDPTTPNRRQVFIVERPDSTLSGYAGADFGCRGGTEPGGIEVAGIVYEDLNRDGQHQEGEPGIAGVLVDGATPQCPTFAAVQVRTDADGFYHLQFGGCPPPYVIGHEPLPGFVDTSPNPVILPNGAPGDSAIVPEPPPGGPPPETGPVFKVDFGVARRDSTQESSVEGVVFEDTNRNGIREDDERGLPGVGVTASGLLCMTPALGLTHTDAVGHYVLWQPDVHCILPWSVGHEPLAGLCDTSPNPVVVGQDRGPDPRHYKVDFGVAPCDSIPARRLAIEGVVFVDLNRSGGRDPGEPGVPGAEVQLVSMCDVLRATRTDMRGHYRFEPDVVGMCAVDAVWQTAPRFAGRTTPNPAPFPGAPPGQNLVSIDFGVLLVVPR